MSQRQRAAAAAAAARGRGRGRGGGRGAGRGNTTSNATDKAIGGLLGKTGAAATPAEVAAAAAVDTAKLFASKLNQVCVCVYSSTLSMVVGVSSIYINHHTHPLLTDSVFFTSSYPAPKRGIKLPQLFQFLDRTASEHLSIDSATSYDLFLAPILRLLRCGGVAL